jgi:cell division GTPase FtsZ
MTKITSVQMARKVIDRTNLMMLDLKNNQKKGTREPDSTILKKFDTSIAIWRNKVKKIYECEYKRKYSKISLEFWEASKIMRQTEIANYRYQKKNLSKYFKLWNKTINLK